MIERLKPEMDAVFVAIEELLYDSDPLIKAPVSQTVKNKGKFLRPMMLVLTAKCGSYDKKTAITVATSLELMHIASLIHDDIVDEGMKRRGAISVQSKFGKDAAVYAGDYTIAKSVGILSQLNDINLVKMFTDAMTNVCRGELRQHALRYKILSTQDYIKIVSNKTGELFGLSLEAGGYIGGIEKDICKELSKIGRMVGIAYQIYDDCLDYSLTDEKALKDTNKDIIQGSYTAPILCAIELDTEGKLKKLLEKPMSEEVIEEIQQTVRDLRGPEVAMGYALNYFEKIIKDVQELSFRRSVNLSELISGLHTIIDIIKNAKN